MGLETIVQHIEQAVAKVQNKRCLLYTSRVRSHCQLVDFGAVRQQAKGLVFLNAGQDKITGPVNGPIPTGAGIRKADDPLYMGRVFLQELNRCV